MIVIDIDNLDNFRFAIAKYAFLQTYPSFKFIRDFKLTNCMLIDMDGEEVIISLLSKPTISFRDTERSTRVVVFKQNREEGAELLSTEFRFLFSNLIDSLLISPKEELFEITRNEMFQGIVLDAKKIETLDASLYKHYSLVPFGNGLDSRNLIIGNISFVHPDTFNDPFDCQCAYSKGSITDKFRVFCSIPYNDNILMWSYYSSNHEGYCFEYNKKEIVNAMVATRLTGVGIIGKVKYGHKRPRYTPAMSGPVTYSKLKYYVNATFSKFVRWSHEDEYRFVMISDALVAAPQYYVVNVPVHNIFVGCKGSTRPLINGAVVKHPVQLTMSISDYKLK